MAGRNTKNPYILSRCGRLCLEIGRKKQAISYFNHVASMVAPQNATTAAEIDLTMIIALN